MGQIWPRAPVLHCDAPKETPQINAQQPVAETMKVLEPQIFRFAEMILRDRCSTSYDLASLFRGGLCLGQLSLLFAAFWS